MSTIFVCGDFFAKDASRIKFSGDLKEVIRDSELSICNLEAPILSNGRKITKSGPSLFQDKSAPLFLKQAGFNAILMANNHMMDYGNEGCSTTMNAFRDFIQVGAGKGIEAFTVKRAKVGSKEVGLLSLVQHEFGVVEGLKDTTSFGVAWINSPDIRDIIIEAKKTVDYLFVFPHAGIEHIDAPLPEWRELYRRFVDWGADAVFASHPHVPQGKECYKGVWIYYSLGNFYFDTLNGGKYWYKSVALKIHIGEELSIKELFLSFDKKGHLMIDLSKDIKEHWKYLNSLIEDERAYFVYINEICLKMFDAYKYNILKGIGGVSLDLNFMKFIKLALNTLLRGKRECVLLNLFQNESHRWLIERAIKLRNC